jgi:hypothetical protein
MNGAQRAVPLLCLVACAGDAEPTPSETPPADLSGAPVVAAACAYYARCAAEVGALFESEEVCRQIFPTLDGTCGSLRFDNSQDEIDVCAAFFATAPCTYGPSLRAFDATPCGILQRVGAERAGVGESCATRSCLPGASCVVSSTPGTCPVCVADLAASATPCVGATAHCASSTYCDTASNACQPLKPADSVCSLDPECLSGECYGGTCLGPNPKGQLCLDSANCIGGLVCVSGDCADPAAPGESCFSWPCQPGYQCDDNNDCVLAAVCHRGTAGQTCVRDSDCAQSLVCNSVSNLCANAGRSMDPCGRVQDCAADSWCDMSYYLCSTRVPEGGPCAATIQCAAGTYCLASWHCVPRVADGGNCSQGAGDEACVSGYCDPTSQTCGPQPVCVMP